MKNPYRILTLALAVVAGISVAFGAVRANVPGPKATAMMKEWERAKAFTKEYLDAATAETISFKPTPDMRSFALQMLHLSDANYGFVAAATGKQSPHGQGGLEKSADQYKTKEALTRAVMDSYDFVLTALQEMDDAKMGEAIKLFNRFDLTRGGAFEKAFEHQTHHRGQLTVYLRMSGVTPPNEKLF